MVFLFGGAEWKLLGIFLFLSLNLGSMAGLIIKPRARIFHGHDWVYAGEIKKVFGEPEPGQVISLKDYKDKPLGSAIYNPESQIVARRISRRQQDLDFDFFCRRLQQAMKYRRGLQVDGILGRVVWSEADGLPGVVLDCYGEHWVLQTLTLAMNQRIDLIAQAIEQEFKPTSLLLRNDAPIRKAEGLSEEIRWLIGSAPAPFEVECAGGLRFQVDLQTGQKTGLYLDQLCNYQAIGRRAQGLRVLDLFSNQGGFGLAAARAGATRVVSVDVSAEAVAAVKANAELNGVAERVEVVEANAFDYLNACKDEFDLIVVDPPSFTRNRKSVRDALRGYKELHLRSLKLLDKGGMLATFCCSHHISREDYLANVISAAVDAKRTLRLLDEHRQGLDHPILPAIPETSYLKGFTFDLVPAR